MNIIILCLLLSYCISLGLSLYNYYSPRLLPIIILTIIFVILIHCILMSIIFELRFNIEVEINNSNKSIGQNERGEEEEEKNI